MCFAIRGFRRACGVLEYDDQISVDNAVAIVILFKRKRLRLMPGQFQRSASLNQNLYLALGMHTGR